jgi:hypothetical protein
MGTGGSRYGGGRPGWRRKCEHAGGTAFRNSVIHLRDGTVRLGTVCVPTSATLRIQVHATFPCERPLFAGGGCSVRFLHFE